MNSPFAGRPRSGRARSRPRPPVEVLEGRQLLSTFTVTQTLDNGGAGTLRWAIGQVNADTTDAAANPDRIDFAIPTGDPGYNATTGVWTIAPTSALPTLARPAVIDGYTQAGASPNTLALGDNAVITIQLDGAKAGATADGLTISGGNSAVRGLAITDFANGVHLEGLGGDAVTGSFIGVDASGSVAAGNTSNGVFIDGVPSNTIGGIATAARDVISGNGHSVGLGDIGGSGVLARNSAGDVVQGNYLGTNRTGRGVAGATGDGLDFADSPGATIGGPAAGAGNVVAGANFYGQGIDLSLGSPNSLVQGNFIGTDATGTLPLGNGGGGIALDSNTAVLDNVISASGTTGLTLANRDLIQGNFIGTDVTGTVALGNGRDGIFNSGGYNTIGGAGSGQGNVISGNTGSGIFMTSELTGYNVIQGNRIGVDITGSRVLLNTGDGITDLDEYNNTIGGTTPGAGNVISGNVGSGLVLGDALASNNLVQGNFIGTNSTGTSVLSNGKDGIDLSVANNTVGGTTPGAGNVVSGNAGYGIVMAGQFNSGGNLVRGNFIGTDPAGTGVMGNGKDGLWVDNSRNTIGGSVAGANQIAYNGGVGVNVVNSGIYGEPVGNAILSNSIHDNARLGIDLGNDGVTPNTPGGPHVGPNLLQNYPVLLAADSTGATTTIVGTLNSTPNSKFTIQFFANPKADPSGHGQGRTYLGELTNVATDAAGNARFSFVAPVAVAGQFLTATATDPNGNTSEFAQDIREGAVAIADLAVVNASAAPSPVVTNGDLTYRFTVANGGPDAALGVVGAVTVPAHTTFVALTTTDPGFTFQAPPVGGGTGSTIALDASSLPASLSSTFALTVRVDPGTPAGTVITNTAAVSSATVDPNPKNNAATFTTTVAALPTFTALSSTPNPSTFGQAVTFSADVTPALQGSGPTGAVTFFDGGSPMATVPLAPSYGGFSGTATFTTATLPGGANEVTAEYNGSALFAPSVAGTITQVVDRAASATTLVVSPSPATLGQSVALTASVVGPGQPGGTVTFLDGTTVLGRAPLGPGGQARLVVSSLGLGLHELDATFAGSNDLLPSASSAVGLVVRPGPLFVGPRVLAVERFGYHAMPTTLALTFSQPLDPALAENPANYRLYGPGGRAIAVARAALVSGGEAVVLQPRERLDVHYAYALIVVGNGPGAVANAAGVPLNAASPGAPGRDFSAPVTFKDLVWTRHHPGAAHPAARAHAIDALLASERHFTRPIAARRRPR